MRKALAEGCKSCFLQRWSCPCAFLLPPFSEINPLFQLLPLPLLLFFSGRRGGWQGENRRAGGPINRGFVLPEAAWDCTFPPWAALRRGLRRSGRPAVLSIARPRSRPF